MIRIATKEDAKALLDIYKYYVEQTTITFEYETPSVEEFERRIENTLKKYPYLVEEEDGKIYGYTIYVDKDARGKGIGKKLYKALEKILGMQNIINVDACITYPEQEDEYVTKNSAQYHTHLGYHMVGRFYKSGYKFGRWYDMVWMEKYIGKHEQPPKEIIPFSKLREKEIQL